MAVQRGPLVLAMDARLNPGLSPGGVSPLADAHGIVPLEAVADPQGIAAHAFRAEGLTVAAKGGPAGGKKVPLVLTSFAEAGQTGSEFAVWLPAAQSPKAPPPSP